MAGSKSSVILTGFEGSSFAESDNVSDYTIVTKKLCYSYDRKVVLDNLSLHISSGSIYALIGSSGCGKSTLLKCLLAQKKPNSGTIAISKALAIPGCDVGYMPQENALINELTVSEFIIFFAKLNN